MALSGAVTGRPRFSYLRLSNISKKKETLIEDFSSIYIQVK